MKWVYGWVINVSFSDKGTKGGSLSAESRSSVEESRR